MLEYTTLNVLIVSNGASYISTQFFGTKAKAWNDMLRWVSEHSKAAREYDITDASPVFVKSNALSKEPMSQYTVGELVRERELR